MRSRYAALAPLLVTLLAASLPAAAGAAGGKKTHLGVPPRQVVNVSTFGVPNDNSGGAIFYYDRDDERPFSVPDGYSFVITDVFIRPIVATLTGTGEMLVVVNDTSRSLSFHYAPAEERHFALAGGLVIPGGTTPTARNPASSHICDVQILGYFVKGEALALGEALFPAPAP